MLGVFAFIYLFITNKNLKIVVFLLYSALCQNYIESPFTAIAAGSRFGCLSPCHRKAFPHHDVAKTMFHQVPCGVV